MTNRRVYLCVVNFTICILVLIQIFVDFVFYFSTGDRTDIKIRRAIFKFQTISGKYNKDFEFRDAFYTIYTADGNISIYSAYLDNITESHLKVRLIGIDRPQTVRENFLCEYFDQDKNHIGTQSSKKGNSSDAINLAYDNSLTFFLCDWPETKGSDVPYYVGLLTSKDAPRDSRCLSKIHYQPNPIESYKFNVVACIQPFHSEYENPVALLEWIEFQRLMGVDHFTFYNYSIGPVSSAVLTSYDSVVLVMNWNIPTEHELRVYGQFVAASDCAHRYRGVAKYVMTWDTDEFLIIPAIFKDYFDYFEKLWKFKEKKEKMNISSIKIRSKVSFTNWSRENASTNVFSYGDEYADFVQELSIPWRTAFLPAQQYKFVMRPDRVLESGVHNLTLPVNGSINLYIPREQGFYFHFRDCIPYYHVPNRVLENNATCFNNSMIETDTYPAQAFSKQLGNRIMDKMKESDILTKMVLEYLENKFLQGVFS